MRKLIKARKSIFRTIRSFLGARVLDGDVAALAVKAFAGLAPTATWYWSNNKLKDFASGLNVTDTVPAGQPVPP